MRRSRTVSPHARRVQTFAYVRPVDRAMGDIVACPFGYSRGGRPAGQN